MKSWTSNNRYRRWLRAVEAVTGKTLSFSDEHIAVVRERSANTVGIVTGSGVEYEIEGTYAEVMAAIGIAPDGLL